MKGLALKPDGTQRGIDVKFDIGIVLDRSLPYVPESRRKEGYRGGTSLVEYIDTVDIPSWVGFIGAFRRTVMELKQDQRFKHITGRNIFPRLRIAYMGLVWRELSIDLVAAGLRQREFGRKISSTGCVEMDSPAVLSQAMTRYHKFLRLMKGRKDERALSLVPTLDIDLCWHTHQLFPVKYREWCFKYIGRGINHDDTIGTNDLCEGIRATGSLWFEEYKEPYTTDNLLKGYFGFKRVFFGIILPPYGIYVLYQAYTLNRCCTGTILYCLFDLLINLRCQTAC